MKVKKIYFNTISEDDGKLIFIEEKKNIPFEIKRVFQIYGVPSTDIVRANHASINTFFVLQAVSGQVSVEFDDGKKKCLYKLNKIEEAVLVPPLIWMKTMFFSKNAILQVYASERYQNCQYIKDYEEFKERVYENEKNSDCWSE